VIHLIAAVVAADRAQVAGLRIVGVDHHDVVGAPVGLVVEQGDVPGADVERLAALEVLAREPPAR